MESQMMFGTNVKEFSTEVGHLQCKVTSKEEIDKECPYPDKKPNKIQELQEKLKQWPESDARLLLNEIAAISPQIVKTAALKVPRRESHQIQREAPKWCVCRHCSEAPSEMEKNCCNKQQCISKLPEFADIVLNDVKALARLHEKRLLKRSNKKDPNEELRKKAYRLCSLWLDSELGHGNRKPLPRCCVLKIRIAFPDPFDQYQGFQECPSKGKQWKPDDMESKAI